MLYNKIKFFSFVISLTLFIGGCGSSLDNGLTKKSVKTLSINSTNPLKISEILASNAKTNYDPDFKEFSDWIELYNDSNKTVDLSGYYLSDKDSIKLKWRFPDGIKISPKSYLIVWTDKKDTYQKALHTNFKLSSKKESLYLYDRDEQLIDAISFKDMKADISLGRSGDDIGFMRPTPNRKNSQTSKDIPNIKKPSFSLESGFYKQDIEVKLSNESQADIYYTTDGSTPNKNSKLYKDPIHIDKTSVIRAVSIDKSGFVSKIAGHTYLIDEDITLPIVSIMIDKKYLYDEKIGIYKNYERDWSRAGSIEYIKNGKSEFLEDVGISIYGGSSRQFPIKSFAISTKKKYGSKYIEYPLFDDKPDINKVRSFILRNGGNDYNQTLMRDAIVHKIAKEIGDIDYLSYQPVVVFLNGKYYGIMGLREKKGAHYIASNHDIDKDNLDVFTISYKKLLTNSGDISSFTKLIEFVENNPLKDNKNYKYVKTQIDIKNLIDYIIVESFVGNIDWINNNIKAYKEHKDGSKWRFILYDTDFAFGLINPNKNVDEKYNLLIDKFGRLKDQPFAKLFNVLMKNDEFKNEFISRYNELLDTVFKPSNIDSIIEDIEIKLSPEISRHFKNLFGESSKMDYDKWQDNVQKIYEYVEKRNDIVREQLKDI